LPLTTRETVASDTPARAATSCIVGGWGPPGADPSVEMLDNVFSGRFRSENH
jgi:hypothetical protein